MVSGRSASSARPTRAETSGAGTKRLDDAGGGMTFGERNDVDAAAPGFDFSAANDGDRRIVAAFHQYVGSERQDELERRVLVEHRHRIDTFERGEHVRALGLRSHGTTRTLETANGGVAVQADDELIAEGAGGGEQVDVADVEQIEDAIREYDGPRFRITPAHRVAPRHHLP